MPSAHREFLQRRARLDPRFRVIEFFEEPTELIRHADRIIAMGGYNTTCEILSFEKPALIVPRVRPHAEQLIRAERLNRLGLLDIMHPEEVDPRTLGDW